MRISQFFEESNGQLSNMRLIATVLVVNGCFLADYALCTKTLDANVIAAMTLMITLGIGGKVVQKKDEA